MSKSNRFALVKLRLVWYFKILIAITEQMYSIFPYSSTLFSEWKETIMKYLKKQIII